MDASGKDNQAFTLIELLCTIGIIALLAALLLPALNQGTLKSRSIHCVSNQHQMGIAFLDFAHSHGDRFPVQVSTNAEGSAEFLEAARTVPGEFFFSYRHFLPLEPGLETPKVLVCPADLQRTPATNFPALRNENLSYFVGAAPESGRPDSVLAGDRNLNPLFGSIAQVGGARYLKWTHELHQYRGNVLFADGHVEQLKNTFHLTNRSAVGVALTPLLMPSVKSPPAAPGPGSGGGEGGAVAGSGAPGGNRGLATVNSAVTNRNAFATNQATKSWAIKSGPPRGGSQATWYSGSSEGGTPSGEVAWEQSAPQKPPPPPHSPAATNAPAPEEPAIATADPVFADQGKELVKRGSRFAYGVPWWLLILLLLGLNEIRRRVRARQATPPSRPKRAVL
ncbi:MAG TPA: prepilin-type N-terminal cleavage/methylation domain-containing protein, partial [Bacillota bacterium]|nr:prepilin-type N-terminal cleavage/methylation domain-containing protein [Bacillota bacterium]